MAALGGAACGNNIQPEYSVDLRLLQGQDPLATATSITLEALGTAFRVTSPVENGKVRRLSLRDLNPRSTKVASFAVTVNNATGPVAYGQSPPILLSEEANLVRLAVQVQAFKSLAQPVYQQAIPRLSDGSVVAALAIDDQTTPAVVTPVLLGGRSLDTGGMEQPTRAGFLYNPFLHALFETNFFPTTSTGAATWARSDGTIWLFGGRIPKSVTDDTSETAKDFSGAADKLGVGQLLNTLRVDPIATYPQTMPPFPRAHAAMTEVPGAPDPLLYIFGGEVVQGEPAALAALDSVVRVDLNPTTPATMVVQMTAFAMLSPRTRHTATTMNLLNSEGAPKTEVLLFGGGADGAPVAEIFDPATGTFAALGADAGPPRRDHKMILLPDGRWLIACGAGSADAPMPDVRIYDPGTRTFTAAPLALATPRSNAACFSAGADLVIAGGRDAAGAIVATAEVFDLASLTPVDTLPAAPRYGAKDVAMPDGTVMLVGGREALEGRNVPSNLYEFYRPRPVP